MKQFLIKRLIYCLMLMGVYGEIAGMWLITRLSLYKQLLLLEL